MKSAAILGCLALLNAALCYAADAGVVTVLDGGVRLLRGATWYKLAEGARVQDGDVIEAPERGEIQLEVAGGDIVNAFGPASLLLVSASPREGKQPADLYLMQGWLKLSTKPPAAPLRLRTPLGVLDGGSTVAVVHAAANTLEIFVESGSARVSESGRGDASAREVRSGDFVGRGADRPFATASGAPQSFVAAMPRYFMDSLPARAEKVKGARVELAVDRPITFAEAEPWLAGPYRRAFVRRLQPRLEDPAFRSAATANAQAYPELNAALAPPAPESAQAAQPAQAPQAKAKEPEKPAEKQPFKLPWPFGGGR